MSATQRGVLMWLTGKDKCRLYLALLVSASLAASGFSGRTELGSETPLAFSMGVTATISPPNGSTVSQTFTLSGGCKSKRGPVSVTGNLVAPVSANCVSQRFQATIALSPGSRARMVKVSQGSLSTTL